MGGGGKKQPFNYFFIQVLLDNFQSFLSSISSLNFINPTTNLSQPGLPLILSVIRKSNLPISDTSIGIETST